MANYSAYTLQVGTLCYHTACAPISSFICIFLQAVLGTFQKLVAGRAHDHEGFKLLQAVVEYIPDETMTKYLPEVCP